ncbi:rhodanese-like domain-containing protein [Ferruginibacter lapsinanis]|uniref:rhodanese-like domain-containing protein n=1 Tax=Ferruginibacter lapsinanis TaxID=563172 RepID=UPI001E482723|nr:rhodanese-like domain-containing protein [Ferruginibacter lapsinanis]UEG50121.1 rhodanese-like domain-containing protein [Ferruginibacter lapsinanis]
MLQLIKNLLGLGPKTDFKALVEKGAVIVDVRSKGEYQSGHIQGAVNIPLDILRSQLSKLKKEKPVITCCASGMRSASAKNILISGGFKDVYNGGGWMSLRNKIN